MDLRKEIRRILNERGMGEPQPIVTSDIIELPELGYWAIERVKYKGEDVYGNSSIKSVWVWEILDKEGETIGSLLPDGTLNYYDDETYVWEAANNNFKNNPKQAATWLWLKLQKPIDEPVEKEEPQMAFESKKLNKAVRSYKIDGIPILEISNTHPTAGYRTIYLNGPKPYSQAVLGKIYDNGLLQYASRIFQNSFEFKEKKLEPHQLITAIHIVWNSLEKITLPDIKGTYAFKVADTSEWLMMTYGSNVFGDFVANTGVLYFRVNGRTDTKRDENTAFPNNPTNALRYFFLKTQKPIKQKPK